MTIHTLTGDDEINSAVMAAMNATIDALHHEGLLTSEQGTNFLDTHICQVVDSDGGLRHWVRRFFGMGQKGLQVLVFKHSANFVKKEDPQ